MTQPNEAFIRALEAGKLCCELLIQRGGATATELVEEELPLIIKAISLAKTMLVDEGLWQDISTAPRDGTFILLTCEEEGEFWEVPEVGYWNPGALEQREDGQRYLHPGFCEYGVTPIRFHTVTHWMPLPAPPGEPAPTVDEGGTEQQLREALQRLVDLKADKDKRGKTIWYEDQQPLAWGQAKAALALPAGQPEQGVVDE